MPDVSPCPMCGKSDLVRFETVIRGGNTYRVFYCGRCNHSWQIAEGDERRKRRRDTSSKPERSRG